MKINKKNKTIPIKEVLWHVWRINEVVAETVSRLFQEQYVMPLISEKIVEEEKSVDATLKNSKEFNLMTSSYTHT